MVDVTHDGHHRRAGHQLGLVALVLAELDVERLEQLAVLVLGRDDLDVELQLGAEQGEGVVVDRLRRRHHLAEGEQDPHQRRGVRADLLGEVGEGRPARHAHDGTAAARRLDAADRRRLHVVELLAPLLLGLAPPDRAPTATERARGAGATTTAAATTGATTEPTRTPGTATAGEATAATGSGTAGTGTGRAGTSTAGTGAAGGTRPSGAWRGTARHHAGVGARTTRSRSAGDAAGTRTCSAGTRGRRPWGPGHGTGRRRPRRGRPAHAGRRGREGVVARTRAGRARAAGCRSGRGSLAGRRRVGRSRCGRLGCRDRGGRLERRCRDDRRGLDDRGCLDRGVDDVDARGRGLLGCCLARCGTRRAVAGGGGGIHLPQLADDRRLDGRRRRSDELTELVELGHDDLALDSELLGQLVDPDLGHCSPHPGPSLVRPDRQYVGMLIGACSSRGHHVVDLPSSGGAAEVPRTPCAGCAGRTGRAGRAAASRYPRTRSLSSGPGRRKARGNALRRSARSRQPRSGCRCAPRPGDRPAGSGVTDPSTTTSRRSSSLAARARQPTQVRRGRARTTGRPVSTGVYASAGRSASASAAAAGSPSEPGTAPSGTTSGRMSIRHPVSRAASRAFWPSRPIASDSW